MNHLYNSVLFVGATGHLGNRIAKAFLKSGQKEFTILIRKESDATEELKKLGAKTIFGDISDPKTLGELKNYEAIVLCFKGDPSWHQNVVDAVKGVRGSKIKRIISSTFHAFDPETVPAGSNPLTDSHQKTLKIMRDSGIPFTAIANGVFYSYLAEIDFFGTNLLKGTFTIVGDGEKRFWTTSEDDIAQLTPYILNDETQINKVTHIGACEISQNILLNIAQTAGFIPEVVHLSEELLLDGIKTETGFTKMSSLIRKTSLIDGNTITPINFERYPDIKLKSINTYVEELYAKSQ